VLDLQRILDQLIGLGGLVANDETAADRVKLLNEDLLARGVENGEKHAVWVEGQKLVGLEDDVTVKHELNCPFATEHQFVRIDDPIEELVLTIGIDGFRLFALQPPDHRPIGVVAATGRGERPVELAADPNRALEKLVLLQLDQQEVGGAHGPMPILKMSKTLSSMAEA